jgi:hypothetical protein
MTKPLANLAPRPPKTGRANLNVALPLDVVLMVDQHAVASGLTRVRIVELALLLYLKRERKVG